MRKKTGHDYEAMRERLIRYKTDGRDGILLGRKQDTITKRRRER